MHLLQFLMGSITETGHSDSGNRVLFVLSVTLLLALVLLVLYSAGLKAKLDDNTDAIENISAQMEILVVENSELHDQNEHLVDALEDYQNKVRSYQTENYELRRQLNLTDNTTILGWRTTVSVLAPAVKTLTRVDVWGRVYTEGYVGIPTNLTLELVPGRGRVLVNTVPAMGEVFQDTAVTAKEVAESISGANLYTYDLIFSIEAEDKVPSVDGPSAGAAMTLMVLSVLENRTIRPDVSITGTIREDGKIGQIGSPIEKSEAADQAGAEIFCIPKENEYTNIYTRVGWFRVVTREEKTADLIAERTDITVHLVEDMEDLFEIATYKAT
jgi:hypothetical protein